MELSADDLRSVSLPFPEKKNQCLIADYLDRETARIDALVAEKEQMLALLEEKRAALISPLKKLVFPDRFAKLAIVPLRVSCAISK